MITPDDELDDELEDELDELEDELDELDEEELDDDELLEVVGSCEPPHATKTSAVAAHSKFFNEELMRILILLSYVILCPVPKKRGRGHKDQNIAIC